MTEHKFTDEEKILSLLKFSNNVYANAKLTPEEAKTLLDLINRQKADIERLTKLLDDKCDRCIARDKAEAIKEFADRLKTYYRNLDKTAGGLVEYHIDQIAKEFLERGATDSQDNR